MVVRGSAPSPKSLSTAWPIRTRSRTSVDRGVAHERCSGFACGAWTGSARPAWEVEPCDFAESRRECLRSRGEKGLAPLSGGAGRVSDVARRSEVIREPAERDRAPEANMVVGGQTFGHVAKPGILVHQVWAQVQHERCLVETAVDPHAHLERRTGTTMDRWEARMSQERQ